MRKIFTFGEIVYDIIFHEDQPVRAVAGGAMLNTAVSLGRTTLPAYLVSELGGDHIGSMILTFLRDNNVNTSHINMYSGRRTAISLAFLDQQKNADYSFYKDYPRQRLTVDLPKPRTGDIVLFGSFYSLQQSIRQKLKAFLKTAKKNRALIIYDPNIRKPHKHEIPGLMPAIRENITMADIVRASDEDIETIYGESGNEEIRKLTKGILIVTKGAKNTLFYQNDLELAFAVSKKELVSTIGAGDNFNAGLIHALYHKKLDPDSILSNELPWKQIIETAHAFAADVCGSYENYISKHFASKFIR